MNDVRENGNQDRPVLDRAGIESLVEAMEEPGPITISAEQANVLTTALEQVASDQILIARLERRLSRYGEADRHIGEQVSGALEALAVAMNQSPIADEVDLQTMREARETLAREIEQATGPGDVWAAALRVVVILAQLIS